MAINPIAFARAVNEQFLRYQLTAFPLADETLARQAEESIRGGGARPTPIIKGPTSLLPKPFGESRQGKIVLVQHRDVEDPATGGRCTMKQYASEKVADESGGWCHARVTLVPLNSEYEPIVLTPESEDKVVVIAEWIRFL